MTSISFATFAVSVWAFAMLEGKVMSRKINNHFTVGSFKKSNGVKNRVREQLFLILENIPSQ